MHHGEETGSVFSMTSSSVLAGWDEVLPSLPFSGLDKPSSLSLSSQAECSSPWLS